MEHSYGACHHNRPQLSPATRRESSITARDRLGRRTMQKPRPGPAGAFITKSNSFAKGATLLAKFHLTPAHRDGHHVPHRPLQAPRTVIDVHRDPQGRGK